MGRDACAAPPLGARYTGYPARGSIVCFATPCSRCILCMRGYTLSLRGYGKRGRYLALLVHLLLELHMCLLELLKIRNTLRVS